MTRLLTKTPKALRFRRIGPGSSGELMTPEEFDAIRPDQFIGGNRYELINGVLVVSPPVSNAEVDPNDELGWMLRNYKKTHPEGSALDATMPERTVPTTDQRRRCDRAIWTGLGRLPDTSVDIPSVVVEFVSAGKRDAIRDYEAKRDEYLTAGVQEYWIIDRFQRIMTVYYSGKMEPAARIITETQDYRTDLLPGFVLPLGQLLAQADHWKPKRKSKSKGRPADAPPVPDQTNPPAGGRETHG
jgi:Uma2 family endonuclease